MKSKVIILPVIMALCACSQSPDCGSSKTQDLVGQIAKRNEIMFDGKWSITPASKCNLNDIYTDADYTKCARGFREEWDKEKSNISYNLVNSIMTYKNNETDEVMCKSTLNATSEKWGEANKNISYQVEKTTDGNIIVNLIQ